MRATGLAVDVVQQLITMAATNAKRQQRPTMRAITIFFFFFGFFSSTTFLARFVCLLLHCNLQAHKQTRGRKKKERKTCCTRNKKKKKKHFKTLKKEKKMRIQSKQNRKGQLTPCNEEEEKFQVRTRLASIK